MTILFAALFVCAPLAAAEIVSAEIPVATMQLVPDASTTCGVVSGPTKAYALCSRLNQHVDRIDLDSDGTPIPETRVSFAARTTAAAGDALFYIDSTAGALVVRRLGSDADAAIDVVATQPRLAWNRGSLLLLTYASGGTLNGAILDTALHIVVPPFPILPAGTYHSVGTAGGGFLVVAHYDASTSARIVDASGALHPVVLPAPFISFDAVAGDGHEYYYLWQRDFTALLAQRYSADGKAIGDAEVVAQGTTGSLFITSVTWTGSDYLIAWSDNNVAWLRARGSTTAQPLGNLLAAVAAGPSGTFLMMSASGVPETIRRLDTNGATRVLGIAPAVQWGGSMTMDGLEAAVVWNENPTKTRFGRTRFDGSHPDGAGVELPTQNGLESMASDGTNHLVVWMHDHHVYGIFADGAPFVIAAEPNDTQTPAVAWTGKEYLVTWNSGSYSIGTGAAVTPSGGVTLFQFGGSGSESSIAAGPRTLVVYLDYTEFYYSKITGLFLDAAGTHFDVARELETGWRNVQMPHAVSNGHDYLVTWTLTTQPPSTEAWVARVDDRGQLIGTPLLAAASVRNAYALPLFDGSHYRVVSSGDKGFSVATLDDACGCLTNAIDIPLDFDITTSGIPFFAAASNDAFAVGYRRPDNARLVLRFLRTPPDPWRHAAKR